MNKTFFGRWGLAILCLVFFMVPFALRGARFTVENMENNVKDWLPADFPETAELTWFGKHFMGEQFILLTWEGCTVDDASFDTLVKKIDAEIKPREGTIAALPADTGDGEARRDGALEDGELEDGATDNVETAKALADERERRRARALGDRLGLYTSGSFYENWGDQQEKWLRDRDDHWYYITPTGDFYRWHGRANLPGVILRSFQQMIGAFKLSGDHLAQLGKPSTDADQNDFYANPRELAARVFSSITTGPEILTELSYTENAQGEIVRRGALWPLGGDLSDEERKEIARQRALDRISGVLYGPDGKQTCMIVTLNEEGKRDLRRVVGRGLLGKSPGTLIRLATEAGVVPPPTPPFLPFLPEERPGGRVLRLGGPTVDNVAIDEEGQITLVRLVGLSVIAGLLISYISFRSVKITIMVFFVGGIAAVASMSMVWWLGSTADAILMSMPSLVYVLGISGAVHIVNYYRDAVEENGTENAPAQALSLGWWPCALAAVTTSLGLLSLCLSNIIPIQKFGFFSALGVTATLIVLFTYLPSALQLWPPGYKRRPPTSPGEAPPETMLQKFWGQVGSLVIRRHGWVACGCLAVMMLLALGLLKIDTDVQLLKLFDKNAKIIRDYTWLEANVGKLVPMELVASVDPSHLQPTAPPDRELTDEERRDLQMQYSFLERMELAAHIQRTLEEVYGRQGREIVGRCMSAASFAPPLPEPDEYRMRLLVNVKLADNRDRLMAEDYLAVDHEKQSELWRISLRLAALDDVDYGRFVASLRQAVEPLLSAYHYRDLALREMVEAKGDEALTSSRIYFLGMTDPGRQTVAKVAIQPEDAELHSEVPTVAPLDQSRLFARTLNDLFRCRGYRSSRSTRKFLAWHDPQADDTLQKIGPRSQEWADWLKSFDCLVLVADHDDYDLDFIRQVAEENNVPLLDAREHQFVSGMPTAKDLGQPIHVVYTGVVPIVYKAQRTLLTSLINSVCWAFVMIASVMMLLLRVGKLRPWNMINFSGGMLSMLPNVFPLVIIFGAMGHMNVFVDIGTMMCASVAMGVAVDDTIHFLTWFRNGLNSGLSRHESILLAYRRVGSAMTQTTLIGGLGLSVFAFSTFTPTQRFGIMMLTLLCAALVGDLIFLPALLAGPLGRFFDRPSKRSRKPTPTPSQEELPGGTAPHNQLAMRATAVRQDRPHRGG